MNRSNRTRYESERFLHKFFLGAGNVFLADLKLFEYFVDSNFAGKMVIVVLAVMNCYAVSLMLSKFQELKKANKHNARDEKRLNDLPSIYDYDDALFPGEGSPYLKICSRAMEAARRSMHDGKVRMNYVENAIKRALAEVAERYEAKMYWLATIVSGCRRLPISTLVEKV